MVKKKAVMRIAVYALVCVIALSFCGCASNEGNTDTLSDYRPMVFVNDVFYGDSGKTISELPANVNSIGTITNTVSQSEPLPEENFYSNNCPTGSEIYCDDEVPEKIYIKLSSLDDEEYSIYERID